MRQMSGKIVVLEVMEDTTVSEFKELLRGWHPSEDDLIRRLSTVDVIVGETKLIEDDETIAQAGVSPEAVVHVHYSVDTDECAIQRARILTMRYVEGTSDGKHSGYSKCCQGICIFVSCKSLVMVTILILSLPLVQMHSETACPWKG